ncbi:MAG: sensor domain-containing diguanylate cyclase [Sphingobium sp.]
MIDVIEEFTGMPGKGSTFGPRTQAANDHQLTDEAGRLAALERYQILDTAREAEFDKITALVRDIFEVPICAVSLVDRERQWFKSIQGLEAIETPRNVAFCAYTILKRAPLVVPDAEVDPRFASNPLVTGDPGIRSYAGVPICTPCGYNLGSLCVIDTQPRIFSNAQVSILNKFAGLVMEEIELRTLAHRDSLTGAATRRFFAKEGGRVMARLERNGRSAALILFDLDHFKKINDSFGHPAGDEVLKGIADCCRAALRPTDVLGRLGGEEFGILLSETSMKDAMAIAERLRGEFARLTFNWAPDVRITASFGISEMTAGPSLDHYMRVTDAALFKAKRNGRNQIVSSDRVMSRAAAA